nr:immunoglobulin light chain junction region [Macaca mulatta]
DYYCLFWHNNVCVF